MKILFILFLTLIIYIAFNNTILNPYLFEGSDKIKHLLAFFVLSFLFRFAFKKFDYMFLVLVLFALSIELAQSFTQREASVYDFLSGVLGIVLFLLLEKFSNRYLNILAIKN